MSKLDNRDQKIKEILQQDKLISKKADDVFNNFLKEERKMDEKNENQKQETNVKKFSAWKKGLAAAACVAIVAGGANIYAATQGYGNVLFMIKYLVTGEKAEVTDKNAILSDRDITISYEPIQLTENIKMQVRRLQIVDGQATLMLVIQEDELVQDSDIVPLKYRVTNSKNESLCDTTSSKEMNNIMYTEELKLSKLYEDEHILNLEVYKNNGQKITKLIIDIDSQTITVEGADEAMKKVSEIDLKILLGEVSAYPELHGEDVEKRIWLAWEINNFFDPLSTETEMVDGFWIMKANRINQLLKEMGYDVIPESFQRGDIFNKYVYNGSDYFRFNVGGDEVLGNTCINISNISYSGGIYKATFTYTDSIGEDGGFGLNPEDMNIYEGTVYFKLNENNEFVKYQIVKFEDMITIDYNFEDDNIDYSEPENTDEKPTEEENIDIQNSTPTELPVSGGIDNYVTSMQWKEYWAPGLKLQVPEDFSITEYSTYSEVVTDPFEKSVIFEGDLTGVEPETRETITSHMKITVYKPQYEAHNTQEEFVLKAAEQLLDYNPDMIGAGQTDSKGEFWNSVSVARDGKRYQLFMIYFPEVNSGLKVLFEYDDMTNYKVVNTINWIVSTMRTTSV